MTENEKRLSELKSEVAALLYLIDFHNSHPLSKKHKIFSKNV